MESINNALSVLGLSVAIEAECRARIGRIDFSAGHLDCFYPVNSARS
jgi:hypothetical protein